eukprot:2269982-Rhodomonas_salina.1
MPVRGYLTEQSVCAIYAERPLCFTRGSGAPATEEYLEQARKYNVSRKTIRDIWKRKRWTAVTAQFCASAGNPQTSSSSSSSSSSSEAANTAAHTNQANLPQQIQCCDQEPASLDAWFAEKRVSLLSANPDESVLSDIKQDPWHGEWEFILAGIDVRSMVAANDMDANRMVAAKDMDMDAYDTFAHVRNAPRSSFHFPAPSSLPAPSSSWSSPSPSASPDQLFCARHEAFRPANTSLQP